MMRRFPIFPALFLLCLAALGGCGSKGPLTLPQPPAKAAAASPMWVAQVQAEAPPGAAR